MSYQDDPDVLLYTEGGVGRIVLNRPKAMNALTHRMALAIDETLRGWETDGAVHAVLIDGAGERGLCAGGDIRGIHEDALGGSQDTKRFWRDEYYLNARIARFPKPYIALMDGVVMGGGIGVSAHGSHRIVTERSKIGMPEVGIGLVPDVGGTYLLARAPGQLGVHAALSTAHLDAADAILCGLADGFVPSGQLDALITAICDTSTAAEIDTVIRSFTQPPPGGELGAQRGWIDDCYAADSVTEILGALAASEDQAANATAKEIAKKSPTSVIVALRALRNAARLGSLEEVLDQEYRISCTCFDSPDLAEGIRAQIIDKDRNPQWTPVDLAGVTDEHVNRYFADRGADELGLAARQEAFR